MRKLLIILLFLLVSSPAVHGESVTLSTYYPSPFGSYDRLRLVPRSDPAEPCQTGIMYTNLSGVLRFCGVSETWGPLVGIWTQDTNDNVFLTDTDNNSDLFVGIGLTNPSKRLDIKGNVRIQGGSDTFFNGALNITGARPAIDFQDPDDAPNTGIRIRGRDGGIFIIQTVSGGAISSRFTVINNGRVGIGTTNPRTQLHIDGDGSLRLQNDSLNLEFRDNNDDDFRFTCCNNDRLNIEYNRSGTWVKRMVIEDSGNVGIGITDPVARLHVRNDIRVSGSTPIVYFEDTATSGNRADFRIEVDNDKFRIIGQRNASDFIECLTIDDDGNVGIGATNPQYKLEMEEGDVNTINGGYRDAGVCVAGTCLSDMTLKENIDPLSNSLEKITQLQPVEFDFTDDRYGPVRHTGLIAQEVEKVFPDWVKNNDDDLKSIHYGLQIQMHLIQATKELKKDLDALHKENKILKERLMILENNL